MASPKLQKKSLFKILICLAAVLLVLLLLSAGILWLKIYEPGKRSADLQRLQQESYQGIFCSMYAPEAFPEDIYSAYMEYDVVRCSHRMASFSDISDYLETAFSSGNEVTHVFLVLDPLRLWNSSLHNNDRFYTSLDEELISYIDSYSGAQFTILFSCPSLEYWCSHNTGNPTTYQNVVRVLTAPLSVRENVSLYFPAGEEWLISNPDAYDTPTDLNADSARSVMLLVLSGALSYRDTEKYSSLDHFSTLVQEAVASPVSYPDLSDYNIVFFGDSVFGNYRDFASIPGVIGALTKADTYNQAIGGSSATQISTDDNSFPSVVQRFLAEDAAALSGDKKLCFVINYGLNDYFSGYTVEEYRDSLQTGVQSLQEAYPDAEILIVSSNFITAFDNGTAHNNEWNEVLSDYVTAAEETATAMNTAFLNINESLQWNAQNAAGYLADAVHPNEEGRFLFGQAIIKALEELLP